MFGYGDHLGAAVEIQGGDVVAMTWGSREIIQFESSGLELRKTLNPSHFVDFQDMQLGGSTSVICTGLISEIVDTRMVHIGGIAVFNLDVWKYTIEVPFFGYSPGGRVSTHNATWFERSGSTLVMYAVPDDGRSDLLVWATELTVGS